MEVAARENRTWPVLTQFMRNKLIICPQLSPIAFISLSGYSKKSFAKMAQQSIALYSIEDSM